MFGAGIIWSSPCPLTSSSLSFLTLLVFSPSLIRWDTQMHRQWEGHADLPLCPNWLRQSHTFHQTCGMGSAGARGGPPLSHMHSWLQLIFHSKQMGTHSSLMGGNGVHGLKGCNYPNYAAVSAGSNAQDWSEMRVLASYLSLHPNLDHMTTPPLPPTFKTF